MARLTLEEVRSGVEERSHRILARLISQIENGEVFPAEVWEYLYSRPRTSLSLGLTGSPGSGKSTLANALIRLARDKKKQVAVLTIDPTSPFSGGAILGDRIRMTTHFTDEGVFIRSLAARENKGGVTAATPQVLVALNAFGFDLVLVETVGVGQNEVDVRAIADVTALILSPGQGDDIQAMKAGIMEIADIFVVNKADLPGAEKLVNQIATALELDESDGPRPPVLRTQAVSSDGVLDLLQAVEDQGALLRDRADRQSQHRRFQVQAHLRTLLERRLKETLKEHGADLSSGERLPHDIADALFSQAFGGKTETAEPRVEQIDHLGVAVGDLGQAREVFETILGLPVVNEEYVEKDKVHTVSLSASEADIELLFAEDGTIARYLSKKGPGIHHMCLRVNNVEGMLAKAEAAGIQLIDKVPRQGAHGRRVAFLHPKSTAGILVELAEVGDSH